MDLEWDQAKNDRNQVERGLPFDLADAMFRSRVIEQVDDRRDYGELRIRAIGQVGGEVLVCVYTDRGRVRRIISLRYANRSERDAYRAATLG